MWLYDATVPGTQKTKSRSLCVSLCPFRHFIVAIQYKLCVAAVDAGYQDWLVNSPLPTGHCAQNNWDSRGMGLLQ